MPFGDEHERVYLALIAGLSALGFIPRCVLQVDAGGRHRLERLYRLISECGSSVHDLSCVELSPDRPKVPRFNMPFELGLAAAMNLAGSRHRWFVLEAQRYQLQKSLSDVNGYDPFIHDGAPGGVLDVLRDMFRTSRPQPSTAKLMKVYEALRQAAVQLKNAQYGKPSLFKPSAFDELVTAAAEISKRLLS